MENNEYLSESEQYEKILNQEQIYRIRDYDLRSIRMKYWNLRHEAHMNEHGISDVEINSVFEQFCATEQKEIAEYRKRRGV